MSDPYTNYETSLQRLLEHLGRDHPRFTEAAIYQQRLMENIAFVRLYGDTETHRAERAAIIAAINVLAHETDVPGIAIVSDTTATVSSGLPPVNQVVGEQRHITMGSGDYAERDIDKRQGVFFERTTVSGDVHVAYYHPVERPPDRNRTVMLHKVRTIWINGLLTDSLAEVVRVDLGLVEHADAVTLPLNAQYQELNREPHIILPGTPMITLFARTTGALLILGAPGSGKTTLLLELARDLLEQAEHDAYHPIPVVFNLSSWAEKQVPLTDWLIDELNSKYDIPRTIAQAWVQDDALLLLLDGLDEVAPAQREACVEAINTYRQEHGIVPIAVCSRSADYEALRGRLRFHAAVKVQPLTDAQIETYLVQAGDKLAGLRSMLHHDTALRELAKTPLMLTIMTLAYQGRETEALTVIEGTEERRRHLFDTYVERMFKRRRVDERYTQHHANYWLTWLARGMVRYHQSIFTIVTLQPGWLQGDPDDRRWIWGYVFCSRILSCSAIGFILGIKLFAASPIEYLLLGLISGGLIGTIDGVELFRMKHHTIGNQRNITWYRILKVFIIWGAVALSVGLLFGITRDAPEQEKYFGILAVTGISLGLLLGMLFGAIFGLRNSTHGLQGDIKAFEHFHLAPGEAVNGAMYYGAVFAVIHLVIGCSVWWHGGRGRVWLNQANDQMFGWLYQLFGLSNEVFQILFMFLSFGVLFGGMFGLIVRGFRGKVIATIDERTKDVRLSPRNILYTVGAFISAFSVFFFVFIGAFIGFDQHLMDELFWNSLFLGITFGLIGALWHGGIDVIHHYTLRFVLYVRGHMPAGSYTNFLDYAIERIFLRKVGIGYTFVHRSLMEYFADKRKEDMDGQKYSEKKPWGRIAIPGIIAAGIIILILAYFNIQTIAFALHTQRLSDDADIYHLSIGDNIAGPQGIIRDDICFDVGNDVLIQANWRMHTGHFITWIGPDGTKLGFLGFPVNDIWDIPDIPHGTPHGALMCRSSHEHQWHVCGSRRRFVADTSGCMEFNINGIEYQKFSGNYYVTVQVDAD